ncbi:hypothetical protein G1H11_08630 [Phytoactinopolyspora alkaliphila]|uniref:Uncharacterized protein n=1 Tax=Phytoactinopolyspora alkaliphila TaxID=1783498 RepID=A0A6N9YKE4_9ACTN|nr:hypothetical protein [Phytoactinopolyspora alkaliphila]NED95380.1 hypothetical protein [Phytoactinopolyspora alkaliphila]
MLTVGALRRYLDGLPDDVPVVVDVYLEDRYLRIENLNMTTAQDATPDGDPHEGTELQFFWDAGD